MGKSAREAALREKTGCAFFLSDAPMRAPHLLARPPEGERSAPLTPEVDLSLEGDLAGRLDLRRSTTQADRGEAEARLHVVQRSVPRRARIHGPAVSQSARANAAATTT